MTRIYQSISMPHRLDIRCPNCGSVAAFEFAEIRCIQKKTDVGFFETSPLFEYRQFEDTCGHYWHAAIYYEGLHGAPERALTALPSGYQAADWNHPKYVSGSRQHRLGSVRCTGCHRRSRHTLNWPNDAYYALSYRHHVLWAFHRESALDLNDYLNSKSRDVFKYRWSSFLLHIPTIFKTYKAREPVAKQLLRLLSAKA